MCFGCFFERMCFHTCEHLCTSTSVFLSPHARNPTSLGWQIFWAIILSFIGRTRWSIAPLSTGVCVSIALPRVRQGERCAAYSSFPCSLRGNLLPGKVFPPHSSYSAEYSLLWTVYCVTIHTSLAGMVIRIHLWEISHSMLSHSFTTLSSFVFLLSINKMFLRELLI